MGKKRRTHTCVICGEKFAGWGNNAAPLANGICCDDCNWEKVIPARIGALGGGAPRAKPDSENGERRSFTDAQDDNAGRG